MIIANEKVVGINYILTNDAGEILDRSSDANPLTFIQGMQNIIPGLESEMEGKTIGDKFKVRINPENAYGVVNKDMIQDVPMEHFQNVKEVQVGMRFQFTTTTGQVTVLRAVAVAPDHVTLDGNHPLAGIHLNFDIEVVSVREATEQELQHGHLHGGAGCCGGIEGGGHCQNDACSDDDDDHGHGHGDGGCGGCC
jgi:FKBP-type peptidyl-prolyl cis-trans isomerase SlyD